MTTRGYIGQVYELRPILSAMEDRGMPIDNDERLALGAKFEAAQRELGAELSRRAGDIGNVDVFATLNPELRKWFKEHDVPDTLLTARFTDKDGDIYRYERRNVKVPVIGPDGEPIEALEERWCRVYDFNPNSAEQVKEYMRAHNHPIPKDRHRETPEGEQPETTAEKELRRLAARTGDDFYLRVVEYRGFSKLRGTYIDGFTPRPDGCVHTSFTFATAIAQLSSRNPNIQNFTKLKPTPALAHAMRGMVAARPGHVLVEWDYKSCHVLTLGFLAEDDQWMRLARLDMHSFVAGHLLGLWDCAQIIHESDAELMARFKWLKSDPERKRVRDDQAKHGILGIGNGLQAKGLYDRYMESFPPRPCPACNGTGKETGVRGPRNCRECKGSRFQPGMKIAERVLEICRQIGPKVFAWQKRVQRLAHDQQYLRTEFGHQRRFYEVYRWDPRRNDWGHGDQAEEAIAYWLSNVAHAHMRETMKAIDRAGHAERYGLFNQIHDALLFHFPEDQLDQHVRDIYPIFAAPSQVLRNRTAPDGLVIDCEASWGHRWNDMHEIDLRPRRTPKEAACPSLVS